MVVFAGGGMRVEWLTDNIVRKLGGGQQVHFWLDNWLGGDRCVKGSVDCSTLRWRRIVWSVIWVHGRGRSGGGCGFGVGICFNGKRNYIKR